MADATYDVVIVGGGDKALTLGMYLAKIGGMKIALFEARNELGGGWESIENSASGFIADVHSFYHGYRMHHEVVVEDIPEFGEYGCKTIKAPEISIATAFSEDDMLSGIYSDGGDPTQERTAKLMSRYSERDAETWLMQYDIWKRKIEGYMLECLHTPAAPLPGGPEGALMRMMMDPDCAKIIDPQWMHMSPRQVYQSFFEAPENQSIGTRGVYSAGYSTEQAGMGLLGWYLGLLGVLTSWVDFIEGGTHNAAHAAQRVIKENGGEYFTNSEVEKVIIENSTAKGVRLKDGTEIGASKFVVTTLSPLQLVEIIGPEGISPYMRRKINLLINDIAIINWYWFALHERPHYKAADVMGLPEIDDTFWMCPTNRDIMRLAREEMRRRFLHESPPYPGEPLNLAVMQPVGDKKRAPEGKCSLLIEQYDTPAYVHDERWWLEHQKVIARAMIDALSEYTTNITWDTVIGYAISSPYTITRLKNMAPTGNWYVIDHVPAQDLSMRPIPELAGHKVPGLKNFYCTGSAWPGSVGANAAPAYNCYKVIAEDYGLPEPPGKARGRPY